MLGEEKASQIEVYHISHNSPVNKRVMIYSFKNPNIIPSESESKTKKKVKIKKVSKSPKIRINNQ